MASNQFFDKKGPFPLKEIIKKINCSANFSTPTNIKIKGIENLSNATKNDLTFLNSSKYKDVSYKTKAAACITTSSFSKFLPEQCIKLNVKNILLAVTQISKMFYLVTRMAITNLLNPILLYYESLIFLYVFCNHHYHRK